MPIVAVNVIKVLVVAALYVFLFYVARSMRGQVTGPPVDTSATPAPLSARRPRSADGAPPATPPDRTIVIFDDVGTPTSHPVHGTVVLGRGKSADIRLDDEYASERHASFTVVGSVVVVEDLESTNGTTIDGRRIVGHIEIAFGTAVTVGHTKVVVR